MTFQGRLPLPGLPCNPSQFRKQVVLELRDRLECLWSAGAKGTCHIPGAHCYSFGPHKASSPQERTDKDDSPEIIKWVVARGRFCGTILEFYLPHLELNIEFHSGLSRLVLFF